MDYVGSGMFYQSEPGLFRQIFDSIMHPSDYYFHLPDLQSYINTQQQVNLTFADSAKWAEMAILNVAQIGKFSSDRTIQQYAREIWKITPPT